MNLKFLFLGLFLIAIFYQQPAASGQTKPAAPTPAAETSSSSAAAGSLVFWTELQKLCGRAYAGALASAPENDADFKGKELVMHVRACEKNQVRIPFFVGANKSRTW